MLEVLGVIPARYSSSRFPGKPLVKILGKPMIIWVAEATAIALGSENVVVATDDDRIHKIVNDYGFNVLMTSNDCLTGTDRVSEVAQRLDAQIYLNIQGDEPLINPIDILEVYNYKKNHNDYIINCMSKITSDENPSNVNLIKIVANESGRLLYMSRGLIPGSKNTVSIPKYYKQVCIYGYNKEQLLRFSSLGRKSLLEGIEDIEILRFLDLGYEVQMLEVESNSYGVDEPRDIDIVEKRLLKGKNAES